MAGVRTIAVGADEAELRLDRWFKRHFPALAHGRLEKLLRTGQVRLDGKRAAAGDRIAPGQQIRVPPLDDAAGPPATGSRAPRPAIRETDRAMLRNAVLYEDADVIVIDKPAGLAVQGGTGTERHLDAMLDALAGGGERPRLVHRLDRDTSGALILARSAAAAAFLAAAFRGKTVRKAYWAVSVGVPKPRQGRIDLALAKLAARGAERVVADEEDGRRAVTFYRTIANAGSKIAWLALEPLTGRTHQLRAHLAAIGTPILGDGKYGAALAHPAGVPNARQLHLHARAIEFPQANGGRVSVTAPLPPHMRDTFAFFGFAKGDERDPFAGLAGDG
jgi:23S rRNA pseudouridine955/2504/2580 synthase